MKERELKELKLTKNVIIPFPNFQPNTIISPTQMNDNFEEIEYAYNNLIDLHNGAISKVEDSLNRSDEAIDRVQGVENDLQDSERKRILNENTRITNESARTSSENIRRENENTRIASEVQREQQELERISTYQTHINDEIKREEKHNQMIGTFNEKVGELDEAIASIPSKEELKGEKGDKGDVGETPSITHLEIKVDEKLNELDEKLSITENTSYTTENGVKEFECKDGYVDNIFIEGKTLVNLWDINKINIYEGISVEDNCVKIIANGSYIDGFPRYENGINFIKPSTEYTVIVDVIKNTLNGDIGLNIPYNNESCFEDSWYIGNEEVQYVKKFTSSNDVSTSITPLRTQVYAEITEGEFIYNAIILEGDYVSEYISYFEGLKSVGQGDKIEVLTKNSDETKQDKKQILTTLRSLPNGVKDTIEKRGNKYVKVQRCGEVVLNGSEVWSNGNQQTNTRAFRCDTFPTLPAKLYSSINCDTFNERLSSDAFAIDEEGIFANTSGSGVKFFVRVNISRLSSSDVTDFKAWLALNPVTVVYELETPIIEELPNFNPQTFSDKTTLLLNSGAVQGEASFEITNSLGSELEVLKGKVSDLDDSISDRLITKYELAPLNGWTKFYGSSYITRSGDVFNINIGIQGGTTTSGTILFHINNPSFIPKNNQVILAGDDVTGGKIYELVVRTNGTVTIGSKCTFVNKMFITGSYNAK